MKAYILFTVRSYIKNFFYIKKNFILFQKNTYSIKKLLIELKYEYIHILLIIEYNNFTTILLDYQNYQNYNSKAKYVF